ncbi:MAG TPA: geranylgeranylglyceryl/heptaprenylglyceryl phosphate synthase, partial [Bacteroidota bacterium]
LDAGSGADSPVPDEMIQKIAKHCSLPMIVGGGIRNPEVAREKVLAGASFIVTGTINEQNSHHSLVREFAEAIHSVEVSGRKR